MIATAPAPAPARILLVDDDPTVIQALRKALAPHGSLRFAKSGEEALRLMREQRPDLVLLDSEMPGMSGFEVCAAMKRDARLAGIPVVFVTGRDDEEFERAALEQGAADFIAKPLRPLVVATRVQTQLRLKAALDRLVEQAATDGLTRLANRRTFDETLQREWQRARRHGTPLSLLLIDVDYFKRYNDHCGHGRGDDCLVAVADVLRGCVRRPFDFVARYGGEEFVVLLPETDAAGARSVGERLLSRIDAQAIPHPASDAARHVTVSIGAASCGAASAERTADAQASVAPADAGPAQPADLLEAADQALYEAKRGGRARQCARSIARPAP